MFISPSESVLLGVVLGEFLRLRELKQSVSFRDRVNLRIRRFIPTMMVLKRERVDESELPEGIEWEPPDEDGVERPIVNLFDDDAMLPESRDFEIALHLVRENGVVFRESWEKQSRNFLDSLAQYLTTDEADHAGDWNALRKWRGDDPSRIELLLEKLAFDNRLAKSFKLGRELGTGFGNVAAAELFLISFMVKFVPAYWAAEVDDLVDCGVDLAVPVIADVEKHGVASNANDPNGFASSWCDQLSICWERLCESLSADALFLRCLHSPGIAQARGEGSPPLGYFGVELADRFDCGGLIEHMFALKTNLCFILGEVLGVLRDRDVEAFARDASSVTPRMFALPPTASRERVGGSLKMAEIAFSDRLGAQIAPEAMIANIGNTVEALTRQLWPDELKRKESVADFLATKRRDPAAAQLERRFAAIGFVMYRQYRVDAEHPSAPFRCTQQEAKMFYSAMCVLHELCEKIIAARPPRGS